MAITPTATVPKIRMGTTPKQKFTLGLQDVSYCRIIITYSQRETILFERHEDDITIDENVLTFYLTQEETLLLRPDCDLEIEVRVLGQDGKAYGAGPKKVKVLPARNREVMSA